MMSMDAIGTSREHTRYQIAFRVYRMMVLMEQKSYSMVEISKELGVTRKTAYRMVKGLETMGVPFFLESHGRWRILK